MEGTTQKDCSTKHSINHNAALILFDVEPITAGKGQMSESQLQDSYLRLKGSVASGSASSLYKMAFKNLHDSVQTNVYIKYLHFQ